MIEMAPREPNKTAPYEAEIRWDEEGLVWRWRVVDKIQRRVEDQGVDVYRQRAVNRATDRALQLSQSHWGPAE